MRQALVIGTVLMILAGGARPARAEDPSPRWLVPTAHAAGVTLFMRVGCSILWPNTYDILEVDRNSHTFATSWMSAPTFDTSEGVFEWDHDPWSVNLIGHGLMGSEFYLRYRQAHHPWWLALTMTVVWTFVWEYFVEAWHKHPSGIDLLWTPTGGALIGEGRLWLYRRIGRMRSPAWRHVLRYVVDPLGQLERDALGLAF